MKHKGHQTMETIITQLMHFSSAIHTTQGTLVTRDFNVCPHKNAWQCCDLTKLDCLHGSHHEIALFWFMSRTINAIHLCYITVLFGLFLETNTHTDLMRLRHPITNMYLATLLLKGDLNLFTLINQSIEFEIMTTDHRDRWSLNFIKIMILFSCQTMQGTNLRIPN